MSIHQFHTIAASKARPASARQAYIAMSAVPEPVGRDLLPPGDSSPARLGLAGHTLLRYQRQHGNRYVQQVLGRPVQAKLIVGRAADVYEQEADRVAEAVVRSNGQPGDAREPRHEEGAPRVSLKASSSADPLGGTSTDAGTEAAITGAGRGGVALQPAVRSRMETAFGSDFGSVRIHQDPDADRLSRQLQARAFTSGSHIFFASGAYQPASSAGQTLLAHELTHVVQQGSAGRLRRGPDRPAAEDTFSAPVHLHRSRAVQRAILAVDGAGDNADALQATRNCLSNLKNNKRIPAPTGRVVRHYPAGDARGQVYGPDVEAKALDGLAEAARSSTISPLETLYFLGHGTTGDIAGLTPRALATKLVNAFAGYSRTFIGALKIVACYSASTMQFGEKGPMGASVAKSYAERLKDQLDIKSSPKFRPRFVEGIRGIAWVDEDTGQRVGYDVSGERKGKWNPLEAVYSSSRWKSEWFNALTTLDPAARKAGMDAILKRAHKRLGVPDTTARRVVGKTARERYLSRSALGDFEVAANELRSAAESKPPNKELAMAALKRMRLDWEAMNTADRKVAQVRAINAYEAYLMAFQSRRPSWQAMAEQWVI